MKNESNQHWDIIGDIHGELEGLRLLLKKLGYEAEGGAFQHPGGRRLLFLGDFIDRGSDSRGVLHLVHRLVDSGQALAIMGNHEFNFVAYHTQDDKGRYLRSHSDNHAMQVAETLQSFDGHEGEIPGWIEWMKGLPFFLDLGDFRAVHASWVPGDIAYLADKSLLDRDFLIAANRRKDPAWDAIGRVLKGAEIEMPDGISALDSNGIARKTMRIRWWGEVAGLSWREVAFPLVAELPEGEAALNGLDKLLAYGSDEPPVFFGHYKLKGRPLDLQAHNVAALDYGLGHGGPATAYRWSGERVIERRNFVQAGAYQVYVDDNFWFMDEDARHLAGEYSDYEYSLSVAKRIVDRSLEGNYQPGMSSEELEKRYTDFGDDAFVVPVPDDRERFSAWDYAKERAVEMAAEGMPAGELSNGGR